MFGYGQNLIYIAEIIDASGNGHYYCLDMDSHTIDGKTVETKHATPREENQGPGSSHSQTVTKVFVGGIKVSWIFERI